MPVLRTKLFKPVLKADYVIRKKILDYLISNSENSLYLVIAPAGYGKSITISQWLDLTQVKYGWISLDEECNDLKTFLEYFVTCIQLSFPDSLQKVKQMNNMIELPSSKVISNLIINEFLELQEEFVLVLDDYHFIKNQQIHDLINDVLKHHPKNLKLVILSRNDTPLLFNSLIVYDKVNEIRMSDLSFDAFEVIELVNKITTKPIDYKVALELINLTEGWILAIRMAIHSLDQGIDLNLVLSNAGNRQRSMFDFLADEILKPLPLHIRECFYKASILSRFCRGLMNDICLTVDNFDISGTSIPTVSFDDITSKTLFIISLDSDKIWFRFHHSFSESLRTRLDEKFSKEDISTLHRKASKWFERNSYFDEALKHSLKAQDLDFANQILENQMQELLENESISLMDRWLKMFPLEAMDRYLAPNLILAFLCDFNQDYFMMEKALNQAGSILSSLSSEKNQNNWCFYYSMQSILFYKTRRIPESLRSSSLALELLNSKHSFLKDIALLYHTLALIASGKGVEAEKKVLDHRALLTSSEQVEFARSSVIVSFISFLSANLSQLYSALHPNSGFYHSNSYSITRGMSYYYLGFVNYQWNHLDEAMEFFNYTWEHRFSGLHRWTLHHVYIQVLTLQAKGDKAGLESMLESAHEFSREVGVPFCDQFLACMEVEVGLRENDFSRVERYRDKANFNLLLPYCFYFVPQLTSVKLKMKEGGVKSFQGAQKELTEIIKYLKTTDNKNLLIQAFALQAKLFKLLGDLEKASSSLSLAIKLARQGRFIRLFVEMGEDIRDLIVHSNEGIDDPFLHKILEVFSTGQPSIDKKPKHEELIKRNSVIIGEENLTFKEIEILKLAALGLQNKEIAEKLFLSPNSIKKYLYVAYQKLNVKNRSRAVEKAKQLRII